MATPLPFLLKSLLISILLGLSLIAASIMDGHRPPVVPYNPSATLVCISNTDMEKIMAESHPFIKLLIKRLVENMRRLGK